MRKTIKICCFFICLVLISLASYKFYEHRMAKELLTIDRIVLQKDDIRDINVEIVMDADVKSILQNVEYAGKLVISKGNHYKGECYFQDGKSGIILISQNYGDISILKGDEYRRCYTFKNGFDEIWLKYIKSKIDSE